MNYEPHLPLLKRALGQHGTEQQLRKLQEECCELGEAIGMYCGHTNYATHPSEAEDLLICEIADVEIITQQMHRIFGNAFIASIPRTYFDDIQCKDTSIRLRLLQMLCCRCGAAVNHVFSVQRSEDETTQSLIRAIKDVETLLLEARIIFGDAVINEAVEAKLMRLQKLLDSEVEQYKVGTAV